MTKKQDYLEKIEQSYNKNQVCLEKLRLGTTKIKVTKKN